MSKKPANLGPTPEQLAKIQPSAEQLARIQPSAEQLARIQPSAEQLARIEPSAEQLARLRGEDPISSPAMSPGYQDAEYRRFLNQYSQRVDPSQDPIFGNFGAQADTPTTMQRPEEFDFDFGGGGGAGGGGIGSAYENYFANQEKYAQEKFDSITDYLDQLQISSDEGFAADMDRISGMYDQRRDARNQRFEEALNRAGGRESAAIDTLAELGIQADANTFDPVTGETRDMLFSQQMSGADMLNSMSYITNTIYDFAKNEQDLAIGAGLENAQQNLLAEMAAIQMARDSKAISDAEAAAAAASAADEAANLQQYYITMGQALGMTPEVAAAAGATGMFGDFFDVATETTPQTYEFPGYEGIDMTIDQAISAGLFEPQEGGIGVAIGGQPTVLPYNTNFQDILAFLQTQGIDVAPISSLQEG